MSLEDDVRRDAWDNMERRVSDLETLFSDINEVMTAEHIRQHKARKVEVFKAKPSDDFSVDINTLDGNIVRVKSGRNGAYCVEIAQDPPLLSEAHSQLIEDHEKLKRRHSALVSKFKDALEFGG